MVQESLRGLIRRAAAVAGALAVTGALGACGSFTDDPADPTTWQAVTDTIGDTVVVRTVAGSVWPGPRRMVPDVTFGTLEGADHYMFGSIASLAVGPDGTIYLVDDQIPALRRYGPDGTWLGDIGRQGGGPGEYENPDGGLRVAPDGRVMLRDPGNGRLSVYSADGTYVEGWPLPSGGGFNTSNQMTVDTAGRVYTLVIKNIGVAVTEWEWGIARMADRGATVDTLTPPDFEFDEWVVSGESQNSSSMTSVPYGPGVSWAVSPFGYFVGGLSTEYRIDLRRETEPVLRIEKAWEPVRVDGREAVLLRKRIEERFKRRFPGWRWNGPDIPVTKPPFDEILVAEDGRIWVRLHTESVEFMSPEEARVEEEATDRTVNRYREPVAFDVFERDGRYLGRVSAPDGFETSPEPVFRGDTVWAVTADGLGVERVSRFHLEPAG
jgi:hypothetical protein